MCFVIEFLMHLTKFFVVGEITSYEEYLMEINFYQIILLYLSAIGLGMWFSKNHELFSKKNLFIWILFPISLTFIIAYGFFDFRFVFDGATFMRGDYHMLTFIYSAFLFLVVIKIISQNPNTRIKKVISILSSATFHIYLTQDIYFSISYFLHNSKWLNGTLPNILGIASNEFFINFGLLIINWIICLSCGIFWWYVDYKLIKYRKLKKIE